MDKANWKVWVSWIWAAQSHSSLCCFHSVNTEKERKGKRKGCRSQESFISVFDLVQFDLWNGLRKCLNAFYQNHRGACRFWLLCGVVHTSSHSQGFSFKMATTEKPEERWEERWESLRKEENIHLVLLSRVCVCVRGNLSFVVQNPFFLSVFITVELVLIVMLFIVMLLFWV